jgi:hypothetical protein
MAVGLNRKSIIPIQTMGHVHNMMDIARMSDRRYSNVRERSSPGRVPRMAQVATAALAALCSIRRRRDWAVGERVGATQESVARGVSTTIRTESRLSGRW